MAKEKVDLIVRRASELLTLRHQTQGPAKHEEMRDLGLIEDGALAVNEDIIVSVGKTSRIDREFKSNTMIEARGRVVMPGFVDPHTHLVFAGAREEEFGLRLQGFGYMEILAKGGGILKTVRETRKANEETLRKCATRTLSTMLKHGTTTIEAKSGYGLSTESEIKCLKVANELDEVHPVDVVSTFLGAHAIPAEFKGNTEDYVHLVEEEMIPEITEHDLAEFCDVFCEKDVFDIEQSRQILRTGQQHKLRPKVHADELTSLGGAELAAEVLAISADHLLFSSERGLRAMAKERVVAVLLPAASFSLMNDRYADARRMIELGLPIALGTDFNPSCWTENMQIVIALACREMRLTPAEAITASTLNAAFAVDRAHEVGSLEVGKKADILLLNIPNHKFLGYRFGVNIVEDVIKNGQLTQSEY